MKNKGLWVFLALMMGAAFETTAQDLLDGWYFNPDQPGSGFNVNRQADITAIALFDFEMNGDNQWSTAVDALEVEGDVTVFEAELRTPETGACFDCPFVPNEGDVGGDTIRIEFQLFNEDGNTSADVTLRGQTETYVRNLFRFSNPLEFLLSTWALTGLEPDPSLNGTVTALTQVIQFDTVGTTTAGDQFIAGRVISGNLQMAIASFTENGGDFGNGNIAILTNDVFPDLDQFWLFRAFKESLIGSTVIGADPVADFIAGSNVNPFNGGRIGATTNSNIGGQSTVQLQETMINQLTVDKPQIKQATPEQIEMAEQMIARMRAVNNQ